MRRNRDQRGSRCQGLHRIGEILLVILSIGALGTDLAKGVAAAMSPQDATAVPSADFCAAKGPGRVLRADPSNYRERVATLQAGDTLLLASGRYPRLTIANLTGEPGRCIIVAGPAGGPRPVIAGQIGHSTVEIVDSSYVALLGLAIDSLGMGGDGIKAPHATHTATHHIVLDGNLIIGAGATQQTDGISTKTPTWNWIIRRNAIVGAGTGIYLGDGDGSSPFVAGIIENNLVLDPLGYCMEF